MHSERKSSSWRQGQFIPHDALPNLSNGYVAVIVSHDCDIPNLSESDVEYIEAEIIERFDGSFRNARHPRRLHLEFSAPDGTKKFVQLKHSEKNKISKQALLEYSPDLEFSIDEDEKRSLKQWLAARYARPSYPDEFENRLRTVEKKFQKQLKKVADHLTAVYFDLNDDRRNELPIDQPYFLGISLVYDSINGGIEARTKTEGAVAEVKKVFTSGFDAGGEGAIVLDYCNSVADDQYSLADVRRTDQWRAEYMSLGDEDDPVVLHGDT